MLTELPLLTRRRSEVPRLGSPGSVRSAVYCQHGSEYSPVPELLPASTHCHLDLQAYLTMPPALHASWLTTLSYMTTCTPPPPPTARPRACPPPLPPTTSFCSCSCYCLPPSATPWTTKTTNAVVSRHHTCYCLSTFALVAEQSHRYRRRRRQSWHTGGSCPSSIKISNRCLWRTTPIAYHIRRLRPSTRWPRHTELHPQTLLLKASGRECAKLAIDVV